MKKITLAGALMLSLCAGGHALAAGTTDFPPAAEMLDAVAQQISELQDMVAQQMVRQSFHDKGIIRVDEVMASTGDPLIQACVQADVAGVALDGNTRKALQEAEMKTIQWPADGKYLGDWEAGEKLAQSGRGGTWRDSADAPAGGNCYNCHQISKEELSYGTIGPSLYNYARIHGVSDPGDPGAEAMVRYTWGRIYNAKAYDACSNMPRFGSHGILTQDQIRDLMALLLDPQSPVNADAD